MRHQGDFNRRPGQMLEKGVAEGDNRRWRKPKRSGNDSSASSFSILQLHSFSVLARELSKSSSLFFHQFVILLCRRRRCDGRWCGMENGGVAAMQQAVVWDGRVVVVCCWLLISFQSLSRERISVRSNLKFEFAIFWVSKSKFGFEEHRPFLQYSPSQGGDNGGEKEKQLFCSLPRGLGGLHSKDRMECP